MPSLATLKEEKKKPTSLRYDFANYITNDPGGDAVKKKNGFCLRYGAFRADTGGKLPGCVIQASRHKEEKDINGLKEEGCSLGDRED